MKKKNIYQTILVSLLLNTAYISSSLHDLDDELFADLENNFSQVADFPIVPECSAPVVFDLICPFLAPRIANNLFNYTNGPFGTRQLLDLPTFFLSCAPHDNRFHRNFWYFYNQTTNAVYHKKGTNIGSYADPKNLDLLDILSDFTLPINIVQVLEMIKLMKIQERRTGIMTGFYTSYNRWAIEMKIPLYYLERNFYFTPKEEKQLKKALLFDDNNSGNTSQNELNKHAVSDQLGLGDTRIALNYRIIENFDTAIDIGLECTLPTHVAIAQGLIGSHFKRNKRPYQLNIQHIACSVAADQTQQALDMALKFGTSAFDKLSSNLLEACLGNYHHVGIAPFVYLEATVNNQWRFNSRAAVEYITPCYEDKFFILKKDPALFSCNVVPGNEQESLELFNQTIMDTIVPRVYKTYVHQGIILKAVACLTRQIAQQWYVDIGIDGWYQGAEKFGTIKAPRFSLDLLRIDIAKRPRMYQSKVLLRGGYLYSAQRCTIALSLDADYTVINSGCGKDFTLALKALFDF